MESAEINKPIEARIHRDMLHKQLYATDASVYKIYPEGVCFPKNKSDILSVIKYAKEKNTPLIPRAAGTSLAGQVVGKGLIVDVSKYFNQIIDFDPVKKTITVEPGITREDLNQFLASHKLFFGPNTSTSNRCTIGGMVGNNSSGTTSIKYGVSRDKVLKMECVLYDGSLVVFEELNASQWKFKQAQKDLEGEIYRFFHKKFSQKEVRQNIVNLYPEASIHRRNTGYALDALLKDVISDSTRLNLCKLLTGSEGTLAFTTAITLQLDESPPEHAVMVATHYDSIEQCLRAVAPLMEHPLFSCEMMDKTILDCTKNNLTQAKNRFFIKGDPMGILLLELRATSESELESLLNHLLATIKAIDLSYDLSVLRGTEIQAAFQLRTAGLGLLGNIVGDNKAVACIEDTAVPLDQLATYITEFTKLMNKYDQSIVYYAHAGAGELHLRPMLNLKTNQGVVAFKKITTDVAHLVKKYKGSMSGEHGDGLVRSSFIPLMLGEDNYQLIKAVKHLFDPIGLFNPGKIVDPLPMDKNLRYQPERKEPEVKTLMDFSDDMGLLRAVEKCNGSGDCRKTTENATICPSYRATKDEKDTTRGRANVLREVLTNPVNKNPFDAPELKEVMDLCISCKACASECPSNVDMAAYKSEFLYQYYKTHKPTLRDRLFAFNGKLSKTFNTIRALQNTVFRLPILGNMIKYSLGIAPQRSIPKLYAPLDRRLKESQVLNPIKTVYLYFDEFTNYLDVQVGRDAFELLTKLGYQVRFLPATESGRAYITKGFLEQAKRCVDHNVKIYSELIDADTPLLGIEPSALYTFKDENLRLASDKAAATRLANHSHLIEAFLATEIDLGNIKSNAFTEKSATIKIHAHCYQKSLGNPADTFKLLNLPTNHNVSLLATGCCGMAGSFGYEKEHYEISNLIGEERLFPSVRKMEAHVHLAANGTSCRHQIIDATGRKALHPISLMRTALI